MENDDLSRNRRAVQIERTRLSDAIVFPIFALVAGIVDAFLILGWHDINPSNLDWLRGDPAVYQAGWEFLRHTPWAFPPTWIGSLDYPFGISDAYLDIIPIIAVPLKLISALLPADFQYLGAYAMLCLIFQTYFGLKLLSRFTSDRTFIVIGALFFLDAPILLNRLSGHFSLCSQWLIVAALYYYFAPAARDRFTRHMLPFAVLLAIAGGISPYIAVMVLGVSIAALFRWFLVCRSPARPEPHSGNHATRPEAFARSLLRGILCLAIWLATMITAFVLSGFLTADASTQLSGSGYTVYSMNLLGPINPVNPAWPMTAFNVLPGQVFEGYNYLGMGVIALGILCLARRPGILAPLGSRSVVPVLAACLFFTFLALSPKITAGDATLFVMPVPDALLHLLSVFRSSGRFFWPANYLILLGAIVAATMAFKTRSARLVVLGAAFLIQIFDTQPIHGAVATLNETRYANPLRAAAWSSLGTHDKHLILLPAYQCDPDNTPGGEKTWPYFARVAARTGLTLNSVHSARPSASSFDYNCIRLPEQVLRGELAADTAYVLSDRFAVLVVERNTSHYCRRVDTLNLCTFDPGRAHLSRLLGQSILPTYGLGTAFRADRAVPRGILMEGWDLRPYPAIWTTSPTASIWIRLVAPKTGDLLLEMDLGGNGALVNSRHPVQRAIISINGEEMGTLTFTFRGDNAHRKLVIPRNLIRDGEVSEIRFNLPDAIAPRDIGINDDGRLLGLYVSRIRIVRAPPQHGLPQ